MKNKTLFTQYNKISNLFSTTHEDGNKYSNNIFYEILRKNKLEGKKILDLGCGDGTDMEYYKYRFGDEISGVDASERFITESNKKGLTTSIGNFDKIPYLNTSFGAVVSKYALQTIQEFNSTYTEVHRVLKDSGKFVFLVVHPMRQFFEKKTEHKNYFNKTIVTSVLFNKKLEVKEPTHTLQEYLSPEFFKLFNIESFLESSDFYSAEKVNNYNYPTYLIISATKK